jgi:hypothetical protein
LAKSKKLGKVKWITGVAWVFFVGFSFGQTPGFEGYDYAMADSAAARCEGESLHNLPLLAWKLTQGLPSEVEKFRAIYTWVCSNIKNDYPAFLKNKRKREKWATRPDLLAEWNRAFGKEVFETLARDKKSICTGYAYLLKELAALAGIECRIVDGYGRTPLANVGGQGRLNHSWNAVKLNDKWYLCDATWSSGDVYLDGRGFVRDYNEGYFLADPVLFAQNHYPLHQEWLLTERKPTLTDFLNAPMVYKRAFSRQVLLVSPTTLENNLQKNERFNLDFKLSGNADASHLSLVKFENGKCEPLVSETITQPDGSVTMSCVFTQVGVYDVDVLYSGDLIYTFAVRVNSKRR